jgi:hypothetical protein
MIDFEEECVGDGVGMGKIHSVAGLAAHPAPMQGERCHPWNGLQGPSKHFFFPRHLT